MAKEKSSESVTELVADKTGITIVIEEGEIVTTADVAKFFGWQAVKNEESGEIEYINETLPPSISFIELPETTRKLTGLLSVYVLKDLLSVSGMPIENTLSREGDVVHLVVNVDSTLIHLMEKNDILLSVMKRLMPTPCWKSRIALISVFKQAKLLPNSVSRLIRKEVESANVLKQSVKVSLDRLLTLGLAPVVNDKSIEFTPVWHYKAIQTERDSSAILTFH